MISQEDVCNKALNFLQCDLISSIDEASAEAKRCKAIYDSVRDTVLKAHFWECATFFDALSRISSEAIPGWAYLWKVPAKCIAIRKVFLNDGSTDSAVIEYRQCISPQTLQPSIATNILAPYIEYTYQVTDPKFYDAKFTEALSLKLAAEIGPALTGNDSSSTKAISLYSIAISEAQRLDAGSKHVTKATDSSYVLARS